MKKCSHSRSLESVAAIYCSQCATPFNVPTRRTPRPAKIAWSIIGVLACLGILSAAFEDRRPSSSVASPSHQASTLQSIPAEYVSSETPAFAITGKVVAVSDGDTITVLDADKQQHKIRLAGIDAPEAGQDFGNKAKQNLSFARVMSHFRWENV